MSDLSSADFARMLEEQKKLHFFNEERLALMDAAFTKACLELKRGIPYAYLAQWEGAPVYLTRTPLERA